MRKRLTIKEFAKQVGVSTATVSRAFDSKGRISEDTRKRIRKLAQEKGYIPNANARNLIMQKSDRIGFFYPSLIKGEPDYFIAEILMGVNEAASSKGYHMQGHPFPFSDKKFEDFYRQIMDGSIIASVIMAGTEMGDKLIDAARKAGVAFVAIGDATTTEDNFIGFDTAQGSEMAGRYLMQSGRKNPVFVKGLQDERKLDGFSKGLSDLSVSLKIDEGGSTFQDGFLAGQRILKNYPETDAIYCANDILAIGCMKAVQDASINVPRDIAIIGCDNIRFSRYYSPALSTIHIPKYELGEKAFNKLFEMIESNKIGSAGEVIPCDFIVRESC
jgi:LacI family transcriptional regulator